MSTQNFENIKNVDTKWFDYNTDHRLLTSKILVFKEKYTYKPRKQLSILKINSNPEIYYKKVTERINNLEENILNTVQELNEKIVEIILKSSQEIIVEKT